MSEVEPAAGVMAETVAETVTGRSLFQWYDQAAAAGQAAGVPVAELRWLLGEAVALAPGDLRLALATGSLSERGTIALHWPLATLADRWQRRLTERVPVQYLAGVVYWREFRLAIAPGVLIPRPETELLVDLAVAAARQGRADGPWLDLGTGSGAIALALAAALPETEIWASDCSAAALAIAQHNVQHNAQHWGLSERIRWFQGDWFAALAEAIDRTAGPPLAGMVSNPPYIPSAEVARLAPEVALHEPHLALDGGPDGLGALRQLVDGARDWLRPGGWWGAEVMAGQAPAVAALLAAAGFWEIALHPDWAGIDRFVVARWPG